MGAPQIGYGAETSGRAILGTVPVEEDGSACFYLPASLSVYFQALDERGCAVQSMRSATYGHGGEQLTCAGCQERKFRAPTATGPSLALFPNQYDRWQPARTLPGQFGARASKLLPLLDKGHYDVRLTPEDWRRLIVWLDANSEFFGASEDAEAQALSSPTSFVVAKQRQRLAAGVSPQIMMV